MTDKVESADIDAKVATAIVSADIDAKVTTAIEAKLMEKLSNSTEIIKKELEPSWARVVSQSVDSKFEKVAEDVNKVQQTLADVKIKE